MTSNRVSRYRYITNADDIKNLEPLYKEEIIKVNEKLKKLNIEEEIFDERFYGGIRGFIRKVRNKEVFLKKDQLSNYGLDTLMSLINSDEKLKAKFKNNLDCYKTNKFWNGIIYDYYNRLSYRLAATIQLIKFIEQYKKSNFDITKLYNSLDTTDGPNCEEFLLRTSVDILQYISNQEIKMYGKKLYDESANKNDEKKKITKEIEQLETSISSHLSKKNKDLEQLRQYKELLTQVSNLLSTKEKNLGDSKEQSKKI